MSVKRCYLCAEDPEVRRLYGQQGLADGRDCPICHRSACRFHLTFVRWRWRDSGTVGTALVCKRCKNSYEHRSWDVANRDWIT